VLVKKEMSSWSLPRRSGRVVSGFGYIGKIDRIADVQLNREVLVLGYNHNIQSTFGNTSKAIAAIRDWVAEESCGALHPAVHDFSATQAL
jgi:hypothetical protein